MMTHALVDSLSRVITAAYPEQFRPWSPGICSIKIDDQETDDKEYAFCTIRVFTSDADSNEFVLTMSNSPCDQDVIHLVHELKGECEQENYGHTIKLEMTIRDAPKVRRLATAIRKTVGRGKRYADSNWKWQAPRAARSLERFAKVLANAYRHARGLESIH